MDLNDKPQKKENKSSFLNPPSTLPIPEPGQNSKNINTKRVSVLGQRLSNMINQPQFQSKRRRISDANMLPIKNRLSGPRTSDLQKLARESHARDSKKIDLKNFELQGKQVCILFNRS